MEIPTQAENLPCWRAQCQARLVADCLTAVMPCDIPVEVLDCDKAGFIVRGGGSGGNLVRMATPGQAAAYMLGYAWGLGHSGCFAAIDVQPFDDVAGKTISWACFECSDSMPAACDTDDLNFYRGVHYSQHATQAQALAWARGACDSC